MTILFFSRLFLYLLAFALPFINPAIVVPYDRVSALIWFFLVPAEMAIAFFLSPPRFRMRVWLGAALAALIITVFVVPGMDSFWLILGAAFVSFALTTLIFHIGTRARGIFVIEQFFLGLFYYRMLTFSQASEDIARATAGLTQLIMALTVVAFLIHGLVLYFTSQRAIRDQQMTGMDLVTDGEQPKSHNPRTKNGARDGGSSRARKEVTVYLAVGIPVLLALAFLVPPNFVKHTVVANLLNRPVHPKPIPLDQSGRGFPDNGSLRNDQYDPFGLNGRQFGRNRGNGPFGSQPDQNGQGGLQGIPADKWQSPGDGQNQGTGTGQGQSGQRAIMIVASKHSPVYAADAYFDGFDPVSGFVKTGTNPLNDLTHLRLLGTWKNQITNTDFGRQPWTVHFFSTITDRVVPYDPDSIDPT
ncbi:MAG TPA: hypothetical protein VMW87_09695, partial [Spirochaetia bacterium]|nr:hypothetical protein [Spirochaetia bacterium]